MNVFVAVFEFVIIIQFLPVSVALSPTLSVCVSLHRVSFLSCTNRMWS